MPAVGIGMCCRPTAYDAVSVYNTILWYLLQGGRHIDTAHIYRNQKAIGQALKEAADVCTTGLGGENSSPNGLFDSADECFSKPGGPLA